MGYLQANDKPVADSVAAADQSLFWSIKLGLLHSWPCSSANGQNSSA